MPPPQCKPSIDSAIPLLGIAYQRASTPLGSYLSTRELPRLKDHKTSGLGDQGTRSRCPLDHETEGAGDQRSRRARAKDQGTSGPKDQRTKGPGDLVRIVFFDPVLFLY